MQYPLHGYFVDLAAWLLLGVLMIATEVFAIVTHTVVYALKLFLTVAWHGFIIRLTSRVYPPVFPDR